MVHFGVNRFFGATVVALVVFLQVTAKQYPPTGLVKEPESICEEGYSLEETFCVKIIQQKSNPVCNWGYLKEGMCVEEYPSMYTCPPQYKLEKLTITQRANARHYKFKHIPQEPQCSRKFVEAPILKCPADYEFDGMFCKKETVIDPACPRGSEQTVEGTCAYYKTPSRKCPEGYSPDVKNRRKPFTKRTKCIKVREVSAEPECKDGYSFAGEHCEKVESVLPVCPNGSKEVAYNKCAYYKKAEMRCPPGFPSFTFRYTSRKECSKLVTVKSYPVCLNGYEFIESQNRCRKVENLALVCPRNTKEVDGNCVRYSSPSRVCRRGFVKIEGMCVKKVGSIRTCEPDYKLDGNSCVKIVSIPPVCPPGAIEHSEHECAVFYDSRSKCLDGFEKNKNDKCVKVMYHDPLVACTKGFTVTGGNRCEKIVSIQPDTICRKGARQGGDCVEYISVPLQYECLADYEKKGNRCTRVVEYDCSTVEYETKCIDKKPDIEVCTGKECELNYSHATSALPPVTSDRTSPNNLNRASLLKNNRASPFNNNQMCEKVVSSKTQLLCKKHLYADPISSCPPHSQAEGEGCVVAKKSSPEFVCKNGFDLRESRCVRILTKDPVYNCPDNYVMKLNGGLNLFPTRGSLHQSRRICKKLEVREPYFICERGEMVENRCVSYFPKKCPNDKCERRIVTRASYGCVAGFDLYSPYVDQRAEDAPCVSTETVSPRLVCNKGVLERDSARCAVFYDKVCPPGGCEKISTMIPRQECPPGFKGSVTCTAIETAEVEYYCSEGEGVLEGEQCVLFVDKRCPGGQCTRKGLRSVDFKCPNGFEMGNSAGFEFESIFPVKKNMRMPMCFLTAWSDMELYCREGEMSYGDRCGIYVDKVCPNGGDCRMVYTVDPDYQCPEGYEISVPPYKKHGRTVGICQKTSLIPAKINCKKGLVSESGKCIKTTKVDHVCLSEEAILAADGTCTLKVYQKPKFIAVY